MRSKGNILSGIVTALFLTAGAAAAGGLSEEFVEVLAGTEPGEVVSGIVVLREQLDIDRIEADIDAGGYTSRWRRHQVVMEKARELARETQPDLVSWLEGRKAEGSVRDFRAFWIANVIAVEAVPEVFDAVALRGDIELIYHDAPVELRRAWEEDGPLPDGGGLLPGQECINLGPAWDQGYTGDGRLVCAFDTGVDGDHVALADAWRGTEAGVDWWEAWHDPYTGSQFPYDSGSHGTHVTGIMTAEHPDGTKIGVAYDARWIAAGILIGYNVSKIIAAYEWAADPDGNAGTIDDVPDVVNNSWGTSSNCSQTYWAAIDVVEAAGVVNTIAVDNTGPGSGSVNSPESRADGPYKNFGVGNVNPHSNGCPINSSSGRGPSPCDGVSIKPEVTAPGTSIYSTIPNNGYSNFSGTSMACPHVSGAVAILRQKNPDLEVDEVKQILMETARDQGTNGEDNTYGWGVIDVTAALEAVDEEVPFLPGPGNLTAELLPPDDVLLDWSGPPGGPGNPIQGFNIYRTAHGQPFPEDPIASAPPNTTSHTDQDVAEGTYDYVVTAFYEAGESGPTNVAEIEVPAPSSVDLPAAAVGPWIEGSPNPVTSRGVLRYGLVDDRRAGIVVYDVGGRAVRSFDLSKSPAGGAEIAWDGSDDGGRPLPSGIYFAVLSQGHAKVRSRLVLLR